MSQSRTPSGHANQQKENTQPSNKKETGKHPPLAPIDEILQRIARLVAKGEYQAALNLTNAHQNDNLRIRNARGACLLRLGRVEEAIRLFRSMVLQPGCTWNRIECPAIYKRNYAIALLLGGHPAGCIDLLSEVEDQQAEMVLKTRAAVRRWQKQLSWFDRFYWLIGQVEPGKPVPIDFAPGEFEWDDRSATSPEQDHHLAV